MGHLERAIEAALKAGQIEVVESWISNVYQVAMALAAVSADPEAASDEVDKAFTIAMERVVEIQDDTVIVAASVRDPVAIETAERFNVKPRGLVRIKATSASSRLALAAAAAEDSKERERGPRLHVEGSRAQRRAAQAQARRAK